MNNIIILKNLKNFTKKFLVYFLGLKFHLVVVFHYKIMYNLLKLSYEAPLWGKIALSTMTSHYVMGVNKLNPHYV